MLSACAYACSFSPVASSRCAAFLAAPLSSAMHTPGRLRGRYSSHRRAASSPNGRAASSRWVPSSPARSVLAAVRICPASESALMIPVYQLIPVFQPRPGGQRQAGPGRRAGYFGTP